MTNEKLILVTAMAVFMAFGTFAVLAPKAQAESRHDTGGLTINIPNGSSDCSGVASAMAMGSHNYYVTSSPQMSLGMAYYGGCGAASIGSAISTGKTLWSAGLTCNEDSECGGAASVTFKFGG